MTSGPPDRRRRSSGRWALPYGRMLVVVEVEEAVRILRRADVTSDDPLTAAELARIEVRLGFTFALDHARLLSACLPTGASWPHWRDATEESLRAWLDLPVRGVLLDVSTNDFWPAYEAADL